MATAVAVAICVVTVGVAPTASAHTSLASSDPAADSTLNEAPTSVELVFAEQVRSPDPKIALTIDGYTPMEIPATIDGSTVRADLTGVDIPGLTDATYPVSWTLGYRLIAADGDPFSGLFHFTVTTAPTPAANGSDTAGGPSSASPSLVAAAPAAPVDSTTSGWVWVLILVLVAVVVAGVLTALRRRSGSSPTTPPSR